MNQITDISTLGNTLFQFCQSKADTDAVRNSKDYWVLTVDGNTVVSKDRDDLPVLLNNKIADSLKFGI